MLGTDRDRLTGPDIAPRPCAVPAETLAILSPKESRLIRLGSRARIAGLLSTPKMRDDALRSATGEPQSPYPDQAKKTRIPFLRDGEEKDALIRTVDAAAGAANITGERFFIALTHWLEAVANEVCVGNVVPIPARNHQAARTGRVSTELRSVVSAKQVERCTERT